MWWPCNFFSIEIEINSAPTAVKQSKNELWRTKNGNKTVFWVKCASRLLDVYHFCLANILFVNHFWSDYFLRFVWIDKEYKCVVFSSFKKSLNHKALCFEEKKLQLKSGYSSSEDINSSINSRKCQSQVNAIKLLVDLPNSNCGSSTFHAKIIDTEWFFRLLKQKIEQ